MPVAPFLGDAMLGTPSSLDMELSPKEWIIENEKRVAYMDILYRLDRRDDPSHPLHRRYTGLFMERQKLLAKCDRDLLLEQGPGIYD